MNTELLTVIVANIVTLLLGYLKIRSDKKEDFKKQMIDNLERDMNLQASLDKMRSEFDALKHSFEIHSKDNEFRKSFYNALSERASLLINNNLVLSEQSEFTDALMKWTIYLQEFGCKFYYSNYRKDNKKELRSYLDLDMNSAISRFDTRLRELIKAEKAYQIHSEMKKINFAEYLKRTEFYRKCQLLVSRLAENGLNDKTMTALFVEYTESFIVEFMKAVSSFRGLIDYDRVIKS